MENLNFHEIGRFTSSTTQQHARFNIKSAPVYTQFDDIKSHFVYVSVRTFFIRISSKILYSYGSLQLYMLMDSGDLPKDLRMYLPLFLEYILDCPIHRDGEFVSHETVAKELEVDVIKLKSCLGLWSDKRFSCGSHSSTVTLSMVVSLALPHNYCIFNRL